MKEDLTGEPIRLVADDIPATVPPGMGDSDEIYGHDEVRVRDLVVHEWSDDEISIIKAHIALHQMK